MLFWTASSLLLLVITIFFSVFREAMFTRAKKSGKNPRVLYWDTQGIHFHEPPTRQELFCSATFNTCWTAYTWQYELWAVLFSQGPEQKASCLPWRDLGHPTIKQIDCILIQDTQTIPFSKYLQFENWLKTLRLASEHNRGFSSFIGLWLLQCRPVS